MISGRGISKLMRARKGLSEGVLKGQEPGCSLWKAFWAILRSFDFIWKAT